MNSNLEEWQIKLAEYFSKQEGRNYPCSNQTVVNGFFGRRFLWDNFVKENVCNIIRYCNSRYENSYIILNNEERWIYFDRYPSARGFRFYKVKIDADLPKKYVLEEIIPLCHLYCCELEWLK